MKRARLLVVLATLSLSATDTLAQPAGLDYDASSTEWNGLSQLYDMLHAGRRDLVFDASIDLASHPVDQPIALLYPTQDLPVDQLLAFVHDGGRLLIADDFGRSGPLLQRLGVSRRPLGAVHNTFFRDNPALPILVPEGQHALSAGVETVLANHPAALSADGRPVVPFDDPTAGLVYDLSYGRGGVVAVADPSLFINFMLDMADNRTLANNIFRHLCEAREPCRIHLITRDTGISGQYPVALPLPPGQGPDQTLAETLQEVNDTLGKVSQFKPDPVGVHWASIFLSLGVTFMLLVALPLSRPEWLQFSLIPSKRTRSRSEFEWNLERLLDGGRDGDYALPLAILKQEFEDLFFSALAKNPGELDPDAWYEPIQLEVFAKRFAASVAKGKGRAAARSASARALSALRNLATLPSRKGLVPEVDARYSERTFKKVYGELRGLLRDLGLWEQYEQRTGRP